MQVKKSAQVLALSPGKTATDSIEQPTIINLALEGRLPELCSATPRELAKIELGIEVKNAKIAEGIKDKKLGVVHIGRGQFEVLDREEAVLLRRERRNPEKYKISGAHLLPKKIRDDVVVFSNLASANLGRKVTAELGTSIGKLDFKQFKDGELSLSIGQTVRDRDVFLIAGTSAPVNEQILELCITIDALKRASAGRVTIMLPYFGYGRQDKKIKGREPITAKLVAKLLQSAGADRIVSLELHSDQSIGFFDIPIDNLRASSVLIPYLRERFSNKDLVVISPDKGGVQRASAYASKLNAPLAMIHKERSEANKIDNMTVLGDVHGKVCLIIDDMTDTGGTLIKAAEKLKQAGAKKIIACCVHPVLSGDAIERIRKSSIEEFITTDSVPLRRARGSKIKVVSITRLLAEAINRMAQRESLTELEAVEIAA